MRSMCNQRARGACANGLMPAQGRLGAGAKGPSTKNLARLFAVVLTTAAALAPSAAPAALIAHGALSRDTGTPFIEDSLNQRQWLGWDVLKGLTFAQTAALTAPGGAYEGWAFAGIADAQMFTNALVGTPNACTTISNPDESCGVAAPGLSALLGANGLPHFDFAWFLSDDADLGEVGLLMYHDLSGDFTKWNEWGGPADADDYGLREDGVAWLLYRAQAVPEPSALALAVLGLGLSSLGATARRRLRAHPASPSGPQPGCVATITA